jgi:hypothetical protein
MMAAAIYAAGLLGCNDNHEQVSTSYQKLPPGEGQKRLQDTLKKRGQSRDLSQPVGGSASSPR